MKLGKEKVEQERDQARVWAVLWKFKTRQYRALVKYLENRLYAANVYAEALKCENDRKDIENERLTWNYNEGLRQYNAQQKRACEAESKIERLREVLEMVEWVDALYGNLCPWCLHSEEYGHDNCPRQTALEATE